MKSTTWILERSLFKQANSEFNPWAWFTWVKWYALAVLLAELCGPIKGPEADLSYVVAQKIFIEYAQVVADSQSGMLWRPIVKLMRRVQKLRGSTVDGMSNLLASPASGMEQPTTRSEIDDNNFANLNINQQPVPHDPAITLDSYNLDPNLIRNSDNPYRLVNNESDQALGMDTFPGEELSWAHWDNFLEDMNNPASFDWAMDWQTNIPLQP